MHCYGYWTPPNIEFFDQSKNKRYYTQYYLIRLSIIWKFTVIQSNE